MEGQSLAGLVVGPDSMPCPHVSFDDGSSYGKSLPILAGTYRGYLVDFTTVPIPPPPGDDERER